jgi:hypothetical protein
MTDVRALMKSSIQTLAAPLVGLVALLTLATIFAVTIQMEGGEISRSSSGLYNASFAYLIALSVEFDRRALGRSAPFEYSAFMFFLWWVLLPVYLFQTRRWRGLSIALLVFILSSLPTFVAWGVYAAYDGVL